MTEDSYYDINVTYFQFINAGFDDGDAMHQTALVYEMNENDCTEFQVYLDKLVMQG